MYIYLGIPHLAFPFILNISATPIYLILPPLIHTPISPCLEFTESTMSQSLMLLLPTLTGPSNGLVPSHGTKLFGKPPFTNHEYLSNYSSQVSHRRLHSRSSLDDSRAHRLGLLRLPPLHRSLLLERFDHNMGCDPPRHRLRLERLRSLMPLATQHHNRRDRLGVHGLWILCCAVLASPPRHS